MKINIIRIILIALLISVLYMIFNFSNHNSEKSSGLSRKITEMITKNIDNIQKKPEAEREVILQRIESIIRKIAHFSIYALVRIFVNVSFTIL